MSNLLESLRWRYATKKFDPERKISAQDLETIKEAISLSASSYGLQPYTVLMVENRELREKLQPVSWGQTQIVDASHLLVFCNKTEVTEQFIDECVALKANVQGIPLEELKGYGDFMKSKLLEVTSEQVVNWTSKQTFIALGNLMIACADLKIDACPMEGFDPVAYNEILNLKEKGLTASVVATIGYRSSEDQTQNMKKVRKPLDQLFEVVV